jgi:hypothetical protein
MTVTNEMLVSGSTTIFRAYKPHRILEMSNGFVHVHKMRDKYYLDVSFYEFTTSDKHVVEWEDSETRNLMVGRFFPIKTEEGYALQVDVTDTHERKITSYHYIDHRFQAVSTFNY